MKGKNKSITLTKAILLSLSTQLQCIHATQRIKDLLLFIVLLQIGIEVINFITLQEKSIDDKEKSIYNKS